ncbi:hypothetical protein SAMN05216582_10588 [Selenomonas ruminantium]|uniref:Uncharacterized protein n=2 Tax=Selenomonas ruminantium TaxID=971 RepID=A0A1M6SV55_SELRU|nr:hypothetical protein SAMN05216582_10588 [Selenomonas ruminantium]
MGAVMSLCYLSSLLVMLHGIWSFLRTVLYYYAQGRGLVPDADSVIRLEPDRSLDEVERLDPYRKFAEEIAGKEEGTSSAAFAIPEEAYPMDVAYCSGYELRYPLKEFLAAAKAEKTSVAALISLAATRAMEKLYPVGDQPLVREITRLICIKGLGSFGLAASTYGDTMYIRSSQRFDSPAIMEGLGRDLSELGLSAELCALPPFAGNPLRVSRLLKV